MWYNILCNYWDLNKSMNQKLLVGIGVALAVFIGVLIWLAQKDAQTSDKGNTPSANLTPTETDHIKGNPDALVTLLEFSDFQCPACGAYHPLIKQLEKDYPDSLRFVYRHYPLVSIHKNATAAAKATEAAARQGQFWEMHDLLFEKQKEWSSSSNPEEEFFIPYAVTLNIDVEKFRNDMNDSAIDTKIRRDVASGDSINLRGTPTFVLDGTVLDSPQSLNEFKTLIDARLVEIQ